MFLHGTIEATHFTTYCHVLKNEKLFFDMFLIIAMDLIDDMFPFSYGNIAGRFLSKTLKCFFLNTLVDCSEKSCVFIRGIVSFYTREFVNLSSNRTTCFHHKIFLSPLRKSSSKSLRWATNYQSLDINPQNLILKSLHFPSNAGKDFFHP